MKELFVFRGAFGACGLVNEKLQTDVFDPYGILSVKVVC
jgi:hypothetical protein